MIFWICGSVTVCGAVLATFIGDLRRATLALWVTGLGVGGLYLSVGAELLAIIQWILSTVIAIAFIFYAVMFGEFSPSDNEVIEGEPTKVPQKWYEIFLPLILGLAFAVVIAIGAGQLPQFGNTVEMPTPAPAVAEAVNKFGPAAPDPAVKVEPKQIMMGLEGLGKSIAENHLPALEILALTLFLVIVGSGVVARLENNE